MSVERKRVHGSLSLHRTGKTILGQMMPSVLLNTSQINMASECGGGSLPNELVSMSNKRASGHGPLGSLDMAATKPFVALGKTCCQAENS